MQHSADPTSPGQSSGLRSPYQTRTRLTMWARLERLLCVVMMLVAPNFDRKHVVMKDRRLEWSLAVGTFGFGMWLVDSAASMDSQAYAVLRSWLSENDWAIMFILTGTLHMVALGINGRAWWTPFIRTSVTSINALIYASFATGFWIIDQSSTAVFMYSWACSQALICIYGAVKDVSRVWGAWRNEP